MSSYFKVILIFFVHCIMLNHSAIAMQSVEPVTLEKKEGNTALTFACKNGHIACARLLLQAGADPCAWDEDGNLPICLAAGLGYIAILDLFAEYYQTDPDFLARIINQQDNHKGNALMWAAWHGRADSVSFLLNHGADPSLTFELNDRNQERKALDWAHMGRTKILRENLGQDTLEFQGTLKSYGAIIEMLTSYELQQKVPTITTSTSLNNQSTLIEATSYDFNDYVCVVDKERTTPAMVAARWGNTKTLQQILRFQQNLELPAISVDPEKKEGNTALTFACKNGHIACARLLLQAGANPCALNQNGNLAICFAISFGHIGILNLFAEYYQTDPDFLTRIINQQDNYQKNALMWAAWYGRADIVRFLLAHGADPSITFERSKRNQELKALTWAHMGKAKIRHENWGSGTLESYNDIIKMLTSYELQQKVSTITTSTVETTSTDEQYAQATSQIPKIIQHNPYLPVL